MLTNHDRVCMNRVCNVHAGGCVYCPAVPTPSKANLIKQEYGMHVADQALLLYY